ncbi:MAG: hypothetical protein HY514_01845 [Candidatus Aenigmarchaeota archaeon]|nr:hypothetical protein [Candidatus Aenigmarchaeota archaeon]
MLANDLNNNGIPDANVIVVGWKPEKGECELSQEMIAIADKLEDEVKKIADSRNKSYSPK